MDAEPLLLIPTVCNSPLFWVLEVFEDCRDGFSVLVGRVLEKRLATAVGEAISGLLDLILADVAFCPFFSYRARTSCPFFSYRVQTSYPISSF